MLRAKNYETASTVTVMQKKPWPHFSGHIKRVTSYMRRRLNDLNKMTSGQKRRKANSAWIVYMVEMDVNITDDHDRRVASDSVKEVS